MDCKCQTVKAGATTAADRLAINTEKATSTSLAWLAMGKSGMIPMNRILNSMERARSQTMSVRRFSKRSRSSGATS